VESFETVLSAARAGGEWAWDRLYADLAPGVTGYLRAHGAAEPDDLAGEVFLQVVRNLPGFAGGEGAFRGWVYTIAHRRLVDDLRRRGRRPVAPTDAAALEGLAGAGGDVEEDAGSRLEDASVRAALDELPTDQRAVLLLRILADLTVEEVARTLGKRPGAVKALQRRALRRVHRAYPFGDVER